MVEGRLEYSNGELLYRPPCGEEQSSIAASVMWVLVDWARKNPGFDAAGNDAGVILSFAGVPVIENTSKSWYPSKFTSHCSTV